MQHITLLEYSKILVPLDGSDLSEKVIDTALTMAGAFDAKVMFLHIHPDAASLESDEVDADLSALQQAEKNLLDQAHRRLQPRHNLAKESISSGVRVGNVAPAIKDAADELGADLIIMGTHGRQGITEWITGSTTERVMANSDVSFMVIRPSGFPYLRD